MASAVSVEAVTGIGLEPPCTNSVGTARPAVRAASRGQLVVHRLERGGVGLDREVQLGERRRRGRLGEVGRPEDRERLREVGVGAAALHRPLVELLGAGHVLGRRASRHLRIEDRLSAVADAAERVDHEGRGDPLGYLDQSVEEQVAAPGVTGHERALPAQAVEHCGDVADLRAHVVRSAGGRRRQASLLVGGHAIAIGELLHERLEVPPGKARPAVQQQHRVALADDRPGQPSALDGDLEPLGIHGDKRRPQPVEGRQAAAVATSPKRRSSALRARSIGVGSALIAKSAFESSRWASISKASCAGSTSGSMSPSA